MTGIFLIYREEKDRRGDWRHQRYINVISYWKGVRWKSHNDWEWVPVGREMSLLAYCRLVDLPSRNS